MEGGSPLLEYLTYGVIGVVLLIVAAMAVRSAMFFLSLFLVPLADTFGGWAPARRRLERWARHGAERDADIWRGAATAMPERVAAPPSVVERAAAVGGALGVLPACWVVAAGPVAHLLATPASWRGDLAAAALTLAMVGVPGAVAGAGLGAAAAMMRQAIAGRRGAADPDSGEQ